MGNEEAIADIVLLMTSFHLEIKALPDYLKCIICKSVLKNACLTPCGCRFCRTCIDDVVSSGAQFCPGDTQECGATSLWTTMPDYRANMSILRLTAKCPHVGCSHECFLADMESHMHACSRKNIDCPFHELGCEQDKLPGEEMNGHLLQESRGHSEILIKTVAYINRDIEMLKQELIQKDEEGKHLENKMKLIIDENKSIKSEKNVLCDRVRQLSEKLEREIDKRRQTDERDIAMVSVVAAAVASNQDEMEPISVEPLGADESYDEWVIDIAVGDTEWACRESDSFSGVAPCYTYLLKSANSVVEGALQVHLLILAGTYDSLLDWPFSGAVTLTVADIDRPEASSNQTRHCRIERPPDNRYRCRHDTPFQFSHAALRGAGLDLRRGVRVSCQIVPGEDMSGPLLQESRSRHEILIGTVANISRDVKMLKRELLLKDEHMENEMKLIMDENKAINDVNKSIIIDIKSVQDEMKSMKIENESIKREKELLCEQLRQLSEKLERYSVAVTAVTAVVSSIQGETESVRSDVRSTRDQYDCMKGRVESIRMVAGLGQLDDWQIEEDLAEIEWGWGSAKTSAKFGAGGEHAFQLESHNLVSRGELWIFLRVWAGQCASLLQWPFRCEVTVVVADRERRVARNTQTRHCLIRRQVDNLYSRSDPFEFLHTALRGAGMNLELGVRVSCKIVPERAGDAVSPGFNFSPIWSA